MIAPHKPRYPNSALPQLYSDLLHAGVILIVVILATIAGGLHFVHENTIGNVYTAAIGYAAGRAGSVVHRTFSSRPGVIGGEGPNIDATE